MIDFCASLFLALQHVLAPNLPESRLWEFLKRAVNLQSKVSIIFVQIKLSTVNTQFFYSVFCLIFKYKYLDTFTWIVKKDFCSETFIKIKFLKFSANGVDKINFIQRENKLADVFIVLNSLSLDRFFRKQET